VGRKPGQIGQRFVLVVLLVVAVSAGWLIARKVSQAPPVALPESEQAVTSSAKRAVYLYFGDAQGRFLIAEKKIMRRVTDAVARGRRLIEALIEGPTEGGSRTLPPDARIRSFFINSTGTAFVDFEADSLADHPGSAGTELLSIYSIVNTLVLNVDEIRSVKFLIGGQEAATLVGHTDLREPFTVDMLRVR